ncbi:type II toxin-antitoxin system HigA family antitoxin [Leptolyngbya sp. BL0902]|uniref:helix-turn-helix domain-containing protein n=1 Tax=Leptolyngbya sp. BL0902 TaxID=1115757 RepID=UPI001CED790C|nr:transcriptional regulator [Leptolyngbya sp. BL0902]
MTLSAQKPIETEADYENALARINNLMDAAPDTPESEELDRLATLVEAYEDEHYPIGLPDSST